MNRILITGGSGDLGRPLSALASRTWMTASTYFSQPTVGGGQPVQLDLRDRAATLRLAGEWHPDVIVHCAASDRSSEMVETNRLAAQHVAEAARLVGARLIALSSDMVFDGRQAPYSEDSPPTPVSVYGMVKAQNEKYVLAAHDNCLVVRTSLIYDFYPPNRQVSWLLAQLDQGALIRLFADEIRCPIWAFNLAQALLELAASSLRGILQVAGPEPLSRYQIGSALLRALGYDPADTAEKVYAAQLMPERPRDLSLDLTRARHALTTPLLSVEEALALAQAGRA